MGTIKEIKMDLHGYHPSDVVQTDVLKKSFSKHGKWVRTMWSSFMVMVEIVDSRQVLLIQTQGTLGWKFVAPCAMTGS